MLQAVSAHTLLDGAPVRPVPGGWTWIAAWFLAACSTALRLLAERPAPGRWALLATSAIWGALAWGLFFYGGFLLKMAPFLLALVVVVALVEVIRSNFLVEVIRSKLGALPETS